MSPTAILNCPEWPNDEDPAKLAIIVKNVDAIYKSLLRNRPAGRIITHGDIKSWHARLFRGVPPVPYYAGHYRSVDLGKPCLKVNVAVPGASGAPYLEVPRMMEEFSGEMGDLIARTDKFMAGNPTEVQRAQAAVQLAAICGGNLIRIHPFVNGNGRTARLLMNWCLNRYGYRMPFFLARPSPTTDYIDASNASMCQDYRPMYRYLLTLMAM